MIPGNREISRRPLAYKARRHGSNRQCIVRTGFTAANRRREVPMPGVMSGMSISISRPRNWTRGIRKCKARNVMDW